MITIPVYELLLLPEVTFFFKKDMFPEGRIKEQNIGEEILFVLQKKEIAPEEISMENIFPVGVMGIIENIDEEGSVKITTRRRVQVTHVEYTDSMVQAEAVDLPDIQDISPEEDQQEDDLLHAGEGGVAVHALAYLDELHHEHQPEHPASDGKHRGVPDPSRDVVHGDISCGREHLREVRADDALVADAREHRHLVGEHPVARVPQKPGEPCVHVVGDARVGGRRRDEHERREEQGGGEREEKAPV